MTERQAPMTHQAKRWEPHARERKACVMWAIERFHADNGYAPTVRDIGNICGFSSTDNVHYWLVQLREEGKVDWVDGRNRTIRVLEEV